MPFRYFTMLVVGCRIRQVRNYYMFRSTQRFGLVSFVPNKIRLVQKSRQSWHRQFGVATKSTVRLGDFVHKMLRQLRSESSRLDAVMEALRDSSMAFSQRRHSSLMCPVRTVQCCRPRPLDRAQSIQWQYFLLSIAWSSAVITVNKMHDCYARCISYWKYGI